MPLARRCGRRSRRWPEGRYPPRRRRSCWNRQRWCSGQGLIVRFYNSSETAVEGRVRFGFPVGEVVPANLLEAPVGPPLALAEEGAFTLTVPAKRIVTLAVTPAPLT